MQRDPVNGRAAAPLDLADGQFDLAGLVQAMWRRKRWIIIPTIFAGLAATAFVTVVTPMYRSQALVLIENRETVYNRPEGGERAAISERLDPEAIQSQVQLALSRDLAREVARDLKLSERGEFATGGISPVSAILRLIGLSRGESSMTAEERLLEKFYERLSVYQVERSRVIAIEFRSANSMLAAEVANAVAERLLVFQQKAKQESMRQASHWLSGEIDQLRKRVAETEARADEFRSKSNLFIGSNNTSLSGQQLGEANSQLVQARAQKAEAEAKARVIRDMLRSGRPIEASDIVNSEVIRRLNDQRVTLKAQLAEQSSTLLDQHPRIKELKAQIADIETQTRSEAEKFVRSLDNDARIASARLDTLSANLDQAKKQASALSVDDVQLRALEREAKSQRDLLESYLARYRDVTAREGPDAVPPDARVLSQAVPSPAPYFPKKLPIILIAMLATLLCTAIFVALAELMSLDGTRRAAIPMAHAMPAPVSSPVPASWIGAASDAPAGRPEPTTETNERRLAAIAEHVRGLGRGVVAVTAADEEEPGSAVALDLAREIGRQGARVLLVDMDVAESSTASLVADPRAPGLADLVFGVASFGEVIQRDRASRIHLIAVGRGVRDADALLAGERLAVVIGAVSQTYDHVIIAVPPLGSVARAERLARFTRGVVLLVAKGGEGAGAASSDMLAARGFSNIVVVSAMKDAPDTNPDRAAA